MIKLERIIDLIKKFFVYSLILPVALIYRAINPNLWVFFSRPDELDGNAYSLYLYAKERRKCLFVLDKNSPFYDKGMIPYHSIRHIFYSFASSIFVFDVHHSSLLYGERIRNALHLKTQHIFLQHGVMTGSIPYYFYEKTGFDVVVCSAKREYEFLRDVFHYPESHLALTGQARHDDLLSMKSDNKYILIMPTWRQELRFATDDEFLKSEFYVGFQSLLNDVAFVDFLIKNDLKIRFYLHYQIQDKLHLFSVPSEIEIYNKTDSVHELLRDCSMLITDFSSVAFDVALAGKAIIYYQFQQYGYASPEQYFDFVEDGFGPVISSETEMISTIKSMWDGNQFRVPDIYSKRSDSFFAYHDTNNCQRIYDRIVKCQGS